MAAENPMLVSDNANASHEMGQEFDAQPDIFREAPTYIHLNESGYVVLKAATLNVFR